MWSIYSAKSRDNARGVYEDAGRDVYDAFLKWGNATAKPAEWLDTLATAKQGLSQRALSVDGIQSLEGPYKNVKAAATECRLGELFDVSYKWLSKFAHPTAMLILASSDVKQEAALRHSLRALRAGLLAPNASPTLVRVNFLRLSCEGRAFG